LINPREIELAVLGNKELLISQPGELIKQEDFYSYDEKYSLGNTHVQIPAKITNSQMKKMKEIASTVYHLCDCS
jgi:D-alanine-D-alanine ligase